MTDPRTSAFIDGLHALESDEDLEPLVALFADDAELGNVTLAQRFHGPEGAREFWQNYRRTFDRIESRFGVTIASGDAAALEWRSRGSLANGSDVDYGGVSVLEFSGERVTRFMAYFDSAELGVMTPSGDS